VERGAEPTVKQPTHISYKTPSQTYITSVTVVEQRLPISVQWLSRISTYAHYLKSVFTTFVLWVCPSIAPKMPARQPPPPRPTLAATIRSVDSTTSTLVDPPHTRCESEKSSHSDSVKENVVRSSKKSQNPFSKLFPPIPRFTRRMSFPGQQLPEAFMSATFHQPQWSRLGAGSNPCFTSSAQGLKSGAPVEVEVLEVVVQSVMEGSVSQASQGDIPTRRMARFHRVSRKVKSLLHLPSHRS